MALLAKDISKQAAEWAARVHSGDFSPDDQARLDAWLAADIRHLGAYARVEAALARLDGLSSGDATAIRPAAEHNVVSAAPFWTRRGMMMAGGLAASIAAVAVVGSAVWQKKPVAVVASPEVYATRIGETRSITLADGSIATLNTNSKIAVIYSPSTRKIRLESGEALFKVAKNKQRPFLVAASDTVVRAVGTAFSVRVLPDRPVQILVKEGVVEVSRSGAKRVAAVRAVAETQTVVAPDAPIVIHPISNPQVARDLAWQSGHIAFAGQTLGDAAVEFARYSDTKIIVDPAIAGKTVTGLFSSNDPVGFAKTAASILSLHVEVGSKEVWIIR